MTRGMAFSGVVGGQVSEWWDEQQGTVEGRVGQHGGHADPVQ